MIPKKNGKTSLYICMVVLTTLGCVYTVSGLPQEALAVSGLQQEALPQDQGEAKAAKAAEEDRAPLVEFDEFGKAKGKYLRSYLGREFSAFFSLPYAKQPTRFKYAKPWKGKWAGGFFIPRTYDASYLRQKCPQKSMLTPAGAGSEDCLQISVYTPNMSPNETMPVMVFLHGGEYQTGEAVLYMPTKLIDRDVVVVVIQYRLGVLGFLYSGTTECPGNMGLMDQVIAIKWVKAHVHKFGGNPLLLNLFGQSSGAASTSLLMMSPLTNAEHNGGADLINSFTCMSGSALEHWTLDNDAAASFLTHAKQAGCTGDEQTTTDEIVGCMRDLPLADLIAAQLNVSATDRVQGGLGFLGTCPVVQAKELADVGGIELVISENPLESLLNGNFIHAPIMTGSARDEGSFVIATVYMEYLFPNGLHNDTDFIRDDMLHLIAEIFGIDDPTGGVADSFRLAFMPEDVVMGDWDDMAGGLVDLAGMLFLKAGMWKLTHSIYTLNSSIPVYFYSFEFESDDTLYEWLFMPYSDKIPIEGGVAHTDDLMYLFNLPTSMTDAREKAMVHRLTTLYANFAKYGNPTPEEVAEQKDQWPEFMEAWEPYNAVDKYFTLLKDDITLEKDFARRWNYNKYGYPHKENRRSPPVEKEDLVNVASARAAANDSPTGTHVAGIVVGALFVCAVALVAGYGVVLRYGKKRSNNSGSNGRRSNNSGSNGNGRRNNNSGGNGNGSRSKNNSGIRNSTSHESLDDGDLVIFSYRNPQIIQD